MQEKLILVDQFGRRTGVAQRAVCHQGKGLRHRAFVVFLLAADGRYLIQRRAGAKLGGDRWDVSATSHVWLGETYAAAIKRCLSHELGITSPLSPEYRLAFCYQQQLGDRAENEHCSLFFVYYDGAVTTNSLEVDEVCWVGFDELTRWFEADESRFTPWFGHAFKRISANFAG